MTNLIGARTCATCKNFYSLPGRAAECRAQPPWAKIVMGEVRDANDKPVGYQVVSVGSAHPPVSPDHVCGVYAPKLVHTN